MQYVGEVEIKTLELHAYYTTAYLESTLYEDPGDGYGYEKGECNVVTFIMSGESEEDMLVMRQNREGNYTPAYADYQITFHGLTYTPAHIFVDDQEVKGEKAGNTIRIKVPFDFKEIQLPVSAKKGKSS